MSKTNQSRLFILALDGTPFTLLNELLQNGIMPNLKKLTEGSLFKQMDSVIPPVSSSAWASFLTGTTPDKHGILGFVDRDPATMDWILPNAAHLRKQTLWQKYSAQNKRVFSMNVPVTYPPKPVNGISICGFLGTDIVKGTYPAEIGFLLKARGYRIDANTELAKKDLNLFLDDLFSVLEKRIETLWHFYHQETWDVFMAHIMETDRLHHFFYEYYEQRDLRFYEVFLNLYRRIDKLIGEITRQIDEQSALLLLSDHGFCTLKYEVYLNKWLAENGFLSFLKSNPVSLKDVSPQSLAYSLYPGRIYMNVRGREAFGQITPGIEYEQVRNRLMDSLKQLRDPQGKTVVKQILRREEVYPLAGADAFNRLPDLIVIPEKGYDFKGNLQHPFLFDKTIFNGTHTSDDAFVLAQKMEMPSGRMAINQLGARLFSFFE